MRHSLFISTILIAPLFATCDKGETTPEEPDATTGATIPSQEEENGNTAGDGKTLIVFFSRAGENEAIRSLFGIPDNEMMMAVIALGYRASEPSRPKRRPLDEIVKFY